MTKEDKLQFEKEAKQGTINKSHLEMLLKEQDKDLEGFYDEEKGKD